MLVVLRSPYKNYWRLDIEGRRAWTDIFERKNDLYYSIDGGDPGARRGSIPRSWVMVG